MIVNTILRAFIFVIITVIVTSKDNVMSKDTLAAICNDIKTNPKYVVLFRNRKVIYYTPVISHIIDYINDDVETNRNGVTTYWNINCKKLLDL